MNMKPAELRNERKKRGWTQAELARRCGVTMRTVVKWENGQSVPRGAALQTLTAVITEAASNANLERWMRGEDEDSKASEHYINELRAHQEYDSFVKGKKLYTLREEYERGVFKWLMNNPQASIAELITRGMVRVKQDGPPVIEDRRMVKRIAVRRPVAALTDGRGDGVADGPGTPPSRDEEDVDAHPIQK